MVTVVSTGSCGADDGAGSAGSEEGAGSDGAEDGAEVGDDGEEGASESSARSLLVSETLSTTDGSLALYVVKVSLSPVTSTFI